MTRPPAGEEERLRAALRQLAEHAPGPGDTGAAERGAARLRARRRRWAGGAAAVLAVAGVLAVVPSTVAGLGSLPAVRSEDPGAGPASGPAGGTSLYGLPVRGSLAGDEDFLAGVRALDWDGPGDPGLRPVEDDRRVVYAADVPGSGRWALVVGRVGRQLVHAWFTGPAGARPDQLALTGTPTRTGTDPAITLLDATRPTGTLVVVGRPGDGAEYSPSLDRDPTGRLRRTYTPLPEADGVPVGEVVTPLFYGAGQVRLLSLRGGRVARDVLVPAAFGGPVSPASGIEVDESDPRYWSRLRECLAPLGFEVALEPDGTGLSWSGGPALAPELGPLSTGERAENDAAFDGCVVRAANG